MQESVLDATAIWSPALVARKRRAIIEELQAAPAVCLKTQRLGSKVPGAAYPIHIPTPHPTKHPTVIPKCGELAPQSLINGSTTTQRLFQNAGTESKFLVNTSYH